MSDQCRHCIVRGDMIKCDETDCSIHESWYATEKIFDKQRKDATIASLREEIAALKAEVERHKAHEGYCETCGQCSICRDNDMDSLKSSAESLEAKVEKVRELLRDVMGQSFDLGYVQLEDRLKAIIGEGKK